MDSILQIILLVNVFLIGVGAAIGSRYAWAHFHPHPAVKQARAAEKAIRLSARTREQLIKEAEDTYRTILHTTTDKLVQDLEHTAERLNKDLAKLGDSLIKHELEHFTKQVEHIRDTAAATRQQGVQDLTTYQAQVKQTMLAEVEQEKTQLLAALDTKLSDSVVAFLVETLQHEVDLGAQTAYLTKMLDEHKADFTGSIKE